MHGVHPCCLSRFHVSSVPVSDPLRMRATGGVTGLTWD